MTKLIIGSYHSEDDAVNAVAVYELKGHLAKNIIILTNQNNINEIKKQTDVEVKSNAPNSEEDSSLTDKIKKIFTYHSNIELDTREKLIEFGLSPEDASKCMTEVNSGKIVVLADDELRMGQDQSSEGE